MQNLHKNKTIDATICIGCVIKGETSHNEYINMSVANALQNMAIATAKPFIFGVLTPNSMEQALDRAGGVYGNKGVESAVTALRMVVLDNELKGGNSSIGFGKS
ncbi:6,7-dimethyl-8-ribityllumazine synthase [Aureispira]|nr:6,7-dimethyl-8-ribityllumazine synthase [Aureispira sp.]